ncbi:MAG: alanine racemase [Bacteroidetes bacterium]|nr:alanine racemase [Bacteroidota bacterium]
MKANPQIQVASVFSHLAASEDKAYDAFTQEQLSKFEKLSTKICSAFSHTTLRHILNSNGITRHTAAQFDMVRLGIGLYGIDASEKVV